MSDLSAVVLPVHAGATWFMTGLVWFVQHVHYPLFARVGADRFTDYQAQHVRRTGHVVLPAMLVELGTAGWLAIVPPAGLAAWLLWLNLALLVMIWGSTFAVQVPLHRRLEQAFDPTAHRRLVTTNWLRTALWSFRAGLVGFMLA